MTHKDDGSIEFWPIKGLESGEVALHIWKPDTFFGNGTYGVHVGGCGVGHASNEVIARELLLQKAKAYCDRQIAKAQALVDHYKRERAKLERRGLVKLKGE